MARIISRRTALFCGVAAATAALASGCSPALKRAARVSSFVIGHDEPVYDPVEARSLPYATMEAKLGVVPPALVVLGRVDGGDLHWITADQIALVTRAGRLVKTAGFDRDLLKTQFFGPHLVPQAAASGITIRLVDLEFRSLYGIPLESRWSVGPREVIDIRGVPVTATRYTEACSARGVDWEFENEFWCDEAGVVWRSLQHFSPGVPPLQLAILKAYSA